MNRRTVDLAKRFLIDYFADGAERQPSDLEDEIFGGYSPTALLLGRSLWLESPFAAALGELVEGKQIYFWEDENGCHYQKKENLNG